MGSNLLDRIKSAIRYRRRIQRYDNDCAIASASCAAGFPYKKILSRAKDNGFVPNTGEGVHAWRALEWAGLDCEWGEGFLEEEYPAVVTIKSIHLPGGFHAVAWDGKRIKDPNLIGAASLDYVRKNATHTYYGFHPIHD